MSEDSPATPGPSGALDSDGRILGTLSQFAAMQVVIAVSAMVRNKVVAHRLGPEQFGAFAQLALVGSTVATLVMFGMGVALSRNAAAAEPRERQGYLSTANGVVLLLAAVAVVGWLALLGAGKLLPLIGLTPSTSLMVAAVLLAAAIPLEGLRNNYTAFLQGIVDVSGLALWRSIAVLTATAVAVPVVWTLGLPGAAVQAVLLSALVSGLLGWHCRSIGYAPMAPALDRRIVRQLAGFGVASLIAGFAMSFSDAAVRSRLILTAGPLANGLLQAPYLLATTVKTVFLTSVGSLALASLSAQRRDPDAMSASVSKLLRVVVPLGTGAMSLLGLLGPVALTVLYSKAFASGTELFPVLLAADVLTVFVWVIGAPLLAFGDQLLWLAIELVNAAVRFVVAALLMQAYGAHAVVLGYLGGVVVHASLTFAAYRLRYRLRVPTAHLAAVLFGSLFAAALSLAGARPWSSLAFRVGVVAWIAYAVVFARRVSLLRELRRAR